MGGVICIEQVASEHLDMLAEPLASGGLQIETLKVHRGESVPETIGEDCGLIVLGGPMNVDDVEAHPHLEDQVALIRRAVADDRPVLGICLGAQLLAKALGASVYRASTSEVGWGEVELTEEGLSDRIFNGLPNPLPVFQWHVDTFDLPSGAVRLATSKECANQSFRYGRRTYGFQFHCEVGEEMASEWLDEYGSQSERLDREWLESILGGFEDMDGVRSRCEQFAVNIVEVFKS